MTCRNLAAGDYLLFTEVDWRNNIRDPTYIASSYGPSLAKFEDLPHTGEEDLLKIGLIVATLGRFKFWFWLKPRYTDSKCALLNRQTDSDDKTVKY